MVVRPKPNFFQLFFISRGSVLPQVAPQIIGVALLSVAVVYFSGQHPGLFSSLNPTPFTLLGLALSIFLTFRNGACYDRWWEGRRQWGQLVVEMRSFCRLILSLFPGESESEFRSVCLRAALGFAHGLNARLRGEDEVFAVDPWLPFSLPSGHQNPPEAALLLITEMLAERLRQGELSDILFQTIDNHLNAMSGIQAACERIKSTPLPFSYTLLLHHTAYLFCAFVPFALAGSFGWATPVLAGVIAYTFFGLDMLGTEIEEPFGRADNDLPLDAMVRIFEVDLLPAKGQPAPSPLAATNFILS